MLLERLRQPGDVAGWRRFAELYVPVLFTWVRQAGLSEADAAGLVHDVFLALRRELPHLRTESGATFRDRLRNILIYKWRQRRRKAVPVGDGRTLTEVAEPTLGDPLDDPQSRADLVGRALDALRPEFPSPVWTAFHQVVVLGQAPVTVAAKLGLSVAAVCIAQTQVLQRLRLELGGWLD
jgi:DNA-directed RNA polymerase specialized sigma24 family protein